MHSSKSVHETTRSSSKTPPEFGRAGVLRTQSVQRKYVTRHITYCGASKYPTPRTREDGRWYLLRPRLKGVVVRDPAGAGLEVCRT